MSRVGGIKYHFKYVIKGQERVTIEITAQNECYDGISNFQDARYVSASETAWSLFSYDILHRNPAVVRLVVHLPNRHTVVLSGRARAGGGALTSTSHEAVRVVQSQ